MKSKKGYEEIALNMVDLLSRKYSFLCIKQDNFNDAQEMILKNASKCQDGTEFMNLAIDSFSKFEDCHLRIADGQGNSKGCDKRKSRINFNREITSKYLANPAINGPIYLGNIEDIFYLGIDSLVDRHEQSFKWLSNLNPPVQTKFIIDLRENGGGSDRMARDIVSYMVCKGERYLSHYLKKRLSESDPNKLSTLLPEYIQSGHNSNFNTNKIVALIGNHTVSSAEGLAMDLSAIPYSKVIGDNSRGASGCPASYIADGPNMGLNINSKGKPEDYGARFGIDIPSWLAYKRDTRLLEMEGIIPDIKIDSEKSFVNGKDLVLEKAIEILSK